MPKTESTKPILGVLSSSSYSRKLESKLQINNMREVWKGTDTITDYKPKCGAKVEGGMDRANKRNLFFFDRLDTPASG